MRILIAGAGVIGTVYGAHLGAAGHAISVLSHPPRTGDIAARGLTARDVLTGNRVETGTVVVPDAVGDRYDLVLAAVRADQLASARAELTGLQGTPAVLFFGNNPGGRAAIPATVPGAYNSASRGSAASSVTGAPTTSASGRGSLLMRTGTANDIPPGRGVTYRTGPRPGGASAAWSPQVLFDGWGDQGDDLVWACLDEGFQADDVALRGDADQLCR